jgi:predicted DNA-binding transcriptional regulator YafY
MAFRDNFRRYVSIIKKLRRQGEATFEEISDYLERESEIFDFKHETSKRTFQRDIAEIFSLFNIEIKYDFSQKVYRIAEEEEQKDMNNRMLEAFDILNLCNVAENISPHVIFEKRRPQGTGNFNGLLHAIQNHNIIRFTYHKFWDDEVSRRTAEPLALKESNFRWYLIARDQKDKVIKAFGLDRLSELDISWQKFDYPPDLNINDKFKNCFGVIDDERKKPTYIVLAFYNVQGKYVKSFPLHETQQILEENEDELKISLRLRITADFIKELLSYGKDLEVISPKPLRTELCKHYQAALKVNKA